jgi:hypothetical protein
LTCGIDERGIRESPIPAGKGRKVGLGVGGGRVYGVHDLRARAAGGQNVLRVARDTDSLSEDATDLFVVALRGRGF